MTVPGPPIAYPVTMIESDIAGRTPAIRETSIWMINRHKASGLKKTGCPHRSRRQEPVDIFTTEVAQRDFLCAKIANNCQ